MTNEQPDMKQEQFADPVRRAFAEHIVALACEWPDAVSRGELADAAAEVALWKAAYFGAVVTHAMLTPNQDINDRRDVRDTFGGATDCLIPR